MSSELNLRAAALAALLAIASSSTSASGTTPQLACEALAQLSLPDTKITLVQALPAGTNASPVGTVTRAICRVAGTVAPAINFEVWMPSTGDWNGRLVGYGGGGLSGSIGYGDLRSGITAGYATTSTDTGHVSTDTAWLSDIGRENDNGHRGIHEMTVKAKAIIAAYYGQGAAYAYFNGCSSGGGQAMMEAWRYPSDYDGILAGDPNWRPTRNRGGSHIYAWQVTHQDPAATIPAAKLTTINNAVLAKCDALDGVVDGVIEDPRVCNFQPSTLACPAGTDATSCLTPAQLTAVKKLYADVRFNDGRLIYERFQFGAEINWGSRILGATPSQAGYDFFRYGVLKDPSFDFRYFDLDASQKLADKLYGDALNVGDADMRPFARKGGKLLMYHGWADGQIQPYNTTDYYEAMVEFFSRNDHHHGGYGHRGQGHDNNNRNDNDDDRGLARVQSFARLFMVPGMGHCGGGPGTDKFDGQGTLVNWVEKGIAPATITASHQTNGVVDKTRPLCPYPQVAVYKGSGSTNDAANFSCKDQRRSLVRKYESPF